MERHLSLSLLGRFQAELDGRHLNGLGYDKVRALLAYLLVEGGRPHSRESLATLLWPEKDGRRARHSLSQALLKLRKALGERQAATPFLVVEAHAIRRNPQASISVDVACFEALLDPVFAGDRLDVDSAGALEEALAHYQGEFLKGLVIGDSRQFEEWATLVRERLNRRAVTALQALVDYHSGRGDWRAAQGYARRQVELEPWQEEAHRQLMHLLARSGDYNAALAQYEACAAVLEEELGVEPMPATKALYGRIARARERPAGQPLPRYPTALVGREGELRQLAQLLAGPASQLITVIGPGGMGKTRLATEAAAGQLQRFLEGVVFVPLAGVTSAEALTTTLAVACGIALEGETAPEEQLLEGLRHREMLLLLDNFEQLIGQRSLDLLRQIVQQCPGCKLLVTSRERLRLLEEEVVDLRGLEVPPAGTTDAMPFGAFALFVQQARRIQPGFSPSGDEQRALVKLCRLVGGWPLALELAAGGVRTFSCEEILQQLQRDLAADFGRMRNRDPRHENLRTVFEYSWSLLAPEEQQIAQRFAVFRGQFDMAAAEAVTGAGRAQVALLLDKSFLQNRQNGWLDIHPLLAQFLRERLNGDPAEMTAAHQRHAAYYATVRLVAPRENMERNYHRIREIVPPNIENLIAAAMWSAEQHDFGGRRLASLIESLIAYFTQFSQRFEAMKVTFGQLQKALAARPDGSYEEQWLGAVLESRIAYADYRLHAPGRARTRLEALLPQVDRLQNGALLSMCQNLLGLLASDAGAYETAVQHLEAAIAAVADHAPHYRFPVYRDLGDAAFAAGQLDRAEQAHETALALALEVDSYDEAAPVYEVARGRLAHHRGDLPEAQEHLRRAVDLARAKQQREEIVVSLARLSWVLVDSGELEAAQELLAEAEEIVSDQNREEGRQAYRLGALVKLVQGRQAEGASRMPVARACYEQSAIWFERAGDRVSYTMALAHLGRALVQAGEGERAARHLQQALRTFQGWDHREGIAWCLMGLGLLRRARGEEEAGGVLLRQAAETAISGGEANLARMALAYCVG